MEIQYSYPSTGEDVDTAVSAKKFNNVDNAIESYQQILKRLEYLEGKVRNLNAVADQHDMTTNTEIRFNGSSSHRNASPEPQQRRQSFRSGTERSFSVDTEIINVKSEEWYKSRHRWNPEINEATLVVSMQPSTKNIAQVNFDNDSPQVPKVDIPFLDRVADRVAIACPILINEVAALTSTSISQSANVILSPFKILVTFQDEFQQKLEEREKSLEEQQARLATTKNSLDCKSRATEGPNTNEMLMATGRSKGLSSSLEIGTSTKGARFVKDKVAEGDQEEEGSYNEWLLEDLEEKVLVTKKRINGLRCIMHFLNIYLKHTMILRAKIKSKTIEHIEFQQLWHLFEPGDLVILSDLRQAYRVLHVTGGRLLRHKSSTTSKKKFKLRPQLSDFVLDCMYIDCDGVEFGAAPKKIVINPFGGKRSIHNLKVFPLAMAPNFEDIENRLLGSGTKFERLAGVAHMSYKGLSIPEGDLKPEEIDSDVIIDFTLAYSNSGNPNSKSNDSAEPSIRPPQLDGGVIEEQTLADSREYLDPATGCQIPNCKECDENTNIYPDYQFDVARRNAFLNDTDLLHRRSPEKGAQDKSDTGLDRDQLLLLPFRVLGYVLLSRRWYPLDIDLIRDIKDRAEGGRDGFEDLVLPEGHKAIVRALVKTHARGAQSASTTHQNHLHLQQGMDLVKGKGKGLIILLHGVPGVGKTSTAECVAMKTNRPLLPITCGDIGITAKEVEENLEAYFELARKWGCVLLLDEADVFLGERTKGDIVQNSLVSVFLRVLEYYSGILILTTNRVGQLDEAIKSRIHIPLYYPRLDKSTTMKIWDMNLKRLDDLNLSRPPGQAIMYRKQDIKQFAKDHWRDAKNSASKHHWNGRQIKNAFQTAIALAEWEALEAQALAKKKDKPVQPLLLDRHFKTVSEASARFDHYLTSVKGSDLLNAKVKKNRMDNIAGTGEESKSAAKPPPASSKKLKGSKKSGTRQGSDSDDDDESSADDSDSSKKSDSSTDTDDDDWKQKKARADAKRRALENKKKEEEEAKRQEIKRQRRAQKEEERMARQANLETGESSD